MSGYEKLVLDSIKEESLWDRVKREYRYLRYRYRRWRCARARAYLMKYDREYRFDQEGKELILARHIAREQGIGSGHPDYPDRDLVNGGLRIVDRVREQM